jgi:hypothetical protein
VSPFNEIRFTEAEAVQGALHCEVEWAVDYPIRKELHDEGEEELRDLREAESTRTVEVESVNLSNLHLFTSALLECNGISGFIHERFAETVGIGIPRAVNAQTKFHFPTDSTE